MQANRLRDSWNDLQDLGIEVLGVSYDSPAKNRRFAKRNDLPFRLLSDGDRVLAKAIGAARTLIPLPKRVSYLVGPDGVVLANYPDVSPTTHAGEVLEDYRALTTTQE